MSIQMVDLKSQYINIKSEVDIAIQNVISNTQFIKGPDVKSFENNLAQYLNVKHVISCANGTDALQIAMMALGLKSGDEIIVPVFTYIATAEVIGLLGLKPVMVDVDPETFCIDVELIRANISSNTKAIVPVHLFGQCANMEEIIQIAKDYNLYIIEDTAQALGSIYTFKDGSKKSAGCIGNIGTTSFFPSKNLGCYGDGGALLTNDDLLAEKLRMICNHGQKIQYVHEVIGVNSRLDTIQAAILNVKLQYLNNYAKNRNEAALWYDELLSKLTWLNIPKRNENSTHVFHQYTLIVKDGEKRRDQLRDELKSHGIPTMVYYPIPLHLQDAFSSDIYSEGSFPIAERLCKSVISLPIHTELDKATVNYICEKIIESSWH